MGRGSSSFCRSGSRTRRDQLERFQAKACPGLDPGWKPVRVKKTRQIKNREPRFDSIEAEKALECRGEGYYRSTLVVRVSAAKQQAVRSVCCGWCYRLPLQLAFTGRGDLSAMARLSMVGLVSAGHPATTESHLERSRRRGRCESSWPHLARRSCDAAGPYEHRQGLCREQIYSATLP